ncbi:hypothetical protein IIC65_09040, partial [Candidatus Sumerlaeota bacterium]|nr:hypothetical protein [Candidatus Sumerlaeota bacterium]
MGLAVHLAVACLIVMAPRQAATDDTAPLPIAGAVPPVTWDGGGADNLWGTPENWSGDAVPAALDNVVFDATSSKDCVVEFVNPEISAFTMTAGYTGTLTVLNYLDFDFGGNVLLEGGTIDWGAANVFFGGDFLRTGGAITADLATFVLDGTGAHTFQSDTGGITLAVLG